MLLPRQWMIRCRNDQCPILCKRLLDIVGLAGLIEEYLKEGRLAEIKVEDLCLERNLNLVYHPHKVWNDPLRDFMDIVRWYGHDEIRAMKTTDGMFHGQTDTNTLLL